MKRILVIGCPGSGKSTFSIALSKATKIPVFHLDNIYWKADKTKVEKSVFLEKLGEILLKEVWIIDGNYGSTMEKRMNRADTIIFLDYPTDVCLEGLNVRKGKKRPDIPWIESEDHQDNEFLEFVRNFHSVSKVQILSLLEKYTDKNVVIFKNREESRNFLDGICS